MMKKGPENYKTKKKARNAVINKDSGPKSLIETPSSNFSNSSTGTIIATKSDDIKEGENGMSPTKKMITMFEGLVSTGVMGKKPFDGESPNEIENEKDKAETLNEKQSETSPEMEDEESSTEVPNPEIENEESSTEVPNPEIENEENSTDVTVESLKERIKEILNIPILNESNECELEADDIDRMHEENMKALKLKLQLSEQDAIDTHTRKCEEENISKKIEPENKMAAKIERVSTEPIRHIATTVTETVMKSIPVNKSSENQSQSLPKCNVEETRKIFTRNVQKENGAKKNTILCNVNDLTGEVLRVNTVIQATPLLSTIQSSIPIIGNNEMDSKYNMEREILEMVKKIKEIPSVDEIQVEYVENASKKPRRSILGRFFGCFSCGMC